MVTMKLLTQEQKEQLKEYIPDIDNILSQICDLYDTISTCSQGETDLNE